MASHDYVLVGTKDGVLLRDPFSSHPMFQEVLIATPEGAMLDVTTAFHEMQLEQLPIPEQPPASQAQQLQQPQREQQAVAVPPPMGERRTRQKVIHRRVRSFGDVDETMM